MSKPADTSAEVCAWMADALISPDWSSERQDRAAALIRALAAERDALLAYRDDWRECAAILTADEPEPGALWELVADISGTAAANQRNFSAEIRYHNATKAERDALREDLAAIERRALDAEAEAREAMRDKDAAVAAARKAALEEAARIVEAGDCPAILAATIRALGDAGDAG